jgi:hypothetical protein
LLAYTQDRANSICSECIEGYQLDSRGQSLDCIEGYEKISENIQECVRKTERWSEYINTEDSWKGKECKSGYTLNSSRLCNEYQEGYLEIQESSLLRIAEILNCMEYDISS